jgi:hypothetical protein
MQFIKRAVLCSLFAALCSGSMLLAADKSLDTAKIDEVTGAKGTLNKQENVYKVSYPRTDIKVTVDGTPMPPFMGLTSWAGFTPGVSAPTMVMGDMVLLQDEVNPAMSAALDNGLTVTALHNHFFYDEPRIFFMHIGGEGSADQLATGVRKIQDAVKAVRSASSEPAKTFGKEPLASKSSITAAPLTEIMGGKPAEKDGMVKFTIGRKVTMPCGCEVGKEMGVNTWAAFYGTNDHAFVDGDFVTFDGELQPVLKTLRGHDINIVAIHTHMEGDNPHTIFLHYWGIGPASDLAKGVKAALDTQKLK